MKRTYKLILMIGLPVIGLIAGYLLMTRTVQATVDGEAVSFRTRALTVGGALRSAGYPVGEGDAVTPAAGSWLSKTTDIELDRTRRVRILVEPGGELLEVTTAAQTAAGILEQAGITPASKDTVRVNGLKVGLDDPLSQGGSLVIEYRPVLTLRIAIDGEERTITSSADNLAAALWQEGIVLRGGDRISPSVDAPLMENMDIVITTGRSITISVDGTSVEGYSAADTVGVALADAGVMLQDLDYSQPGAAEPVPEDGLIRVVRVSETLISEQKLIAFETESVADDTMEMNQREVIQEGANGLAFTRVKVRYEDGEEVARETQSDVILSEPVTQIVNYGTKIVDMYLDTPDGPISYYLAVNVVATAYSPCRSGVPNKCYPLTKLGIPVTKGVIAVHLPWYNIFAGTQAYVPGYGVGTIADTGYYPYNDNWIDLGYSDEDFVSWGTTNTTIYFLSPAPPGFTGVLP